MRRRRTLLLAALALAVPLPAFAVSGEDSATPAPAALTVTASLDHCGIAEATVVCKIDASWSSIPGATRYTASVTSPDGSVVDYGSVGAGGTSFWVPYVGAGTYTVEVSAWGRPPGAERAKLIDEDSSAAGGRKREPADELPGPERIAEAPGADEPAPDDPTGEDPAEEPPAEEPPVEESPDCEEPQEDPAADEPPVTEPAEPGAPEADATEPATATAPADGAPTLEEQAEVPDEIACPDPAG